MKRKYPLLNTAIGLSIFLASILKARLSKLRNKFKPNPEQDTTHTDEQERDTQPPETTPHLVSQSLYSDAESPNTNKSNPETKQEKGNTEVYWLAQQTMWVRRQTIFSVVLAVLTLGVLAYQAWISKGQQDVMREQVGQMSEQLKAMNRTVNQTQEMLGYAGTQANASMTQANASMTQANTSVAQVEIANKSLSATETAARAAEQSTQIARESFYIGERPYVIVTKIDGNLAPDRPVNVEYTFLNSGRTPAVRLILEPFFHWDITPPSEPFFPTPVTCSGNNEIYLAAQESKRVTFTSNNVLTNNALEDLKSGTILLYTYGRGCYIDGLGKRYYLEFCHRYNVTTSKLSQCPKHNYTK